METYRSDLVNSVMEVMYRKLYRMSNHPVQEMKIRELNRTDKTRNRKGKL